MAPKRIVGKTKLAKAVPNLAEGRKPRIWFLGRKVAVGSGQLDLARAALHRARNKKKSWGTKEWNVALQAALEPFRQGISWGGSRTWSASLAVGSEKGDPKAQRPRAQKKESPADATIVPVGVPTELPAAELQAASRSDWAAAGVQGIDRLRNRLRLQRPCSFVGNGTFGQVYRMSAVPYSGAGEAVPQTVAVKVMSRMEEASAIGDQDQLSRDVRREIELLAISAGQGIVELLSWSEGLFDVHLAFPLYTENLHSYTHRGALQVTSAVGDKSDKMPSICKQLLTGLSRLHDLQIIHRDLKPANMLIDASAVGDFEQGRVVLADLGGAIRVSAIVGDVAQTRDGDVSADKDDGAQINPTTYQYRAPELFLSKTPRSHSYASDVWAMGVSIAHMDLGRVPFGRLAMRRPQIEDIFVDQMRVLYKTSAERFDAQIRKDATRFLQKLGTLRLQDASCLPWGKSRGRVFQTFLHTFFLPSPQSRPLARTLTQHKALRG